MGLFSFGKKTKDTKHNQKETKEKISFLNNRKYDRYILNSKEIIDISKNGVRIKKEIPDQIKKEFVEIKIDNKTFKGKIIQDKRDYFSIELLEELEDLQFIKKYIFKLEDVEEDLEKKPDIDFSLCVQNENLRAVINLLAELEDPNTNSEKLIMYIQKLPDLEMQILEIANSIEEKAVVEIKDLQTAIARLGFDRLKNIVRDVVNKKISFSDSSLSNFEYFEAFNIFKTIFFKEVSPLFSFKDIKNEGRTLLSTETAVLTFFTQKKSFFKDYYKNPKRLYSPVSRFIEKEQFNIDFLELGKMYFVDYLGFFKYLYDGYILAHLFLNPYLDFNKIKISVSSRKLRFAYITYLTFLASISILQKDRRYAYILLNRIKRFGMDTGKALEFINSIITASNNALSNIGLRRSLKPLSIPSFTINLKKIFPENLYFDYFLNSLKSASNLNRVVLRSDDPGFSGYILDLILNAAELPFKNESFCIIPCENLEDEDIDISNFEGFDIVIFKNIDRLNKNLFSNIEKIWKEFEGRIFATYSTFSFIDFENKNLFRLLNPFTVDIPSFFNSSKSYEFLKERLKEEIDQVLEDVTYSKGNFITYHNSSLKYILYDIAKTLHLFQ